MISSHTRTHIQNEHKNDVKTFLPKSTQTELCRKIRTAENAMTENIDDQKNRAWIHFFI